jgi:hypothetical protein
MKLIAGIRRRWTVLSRTRKILAAIVAIITAAGTIISAIVGVVVFLADPPDWFRVPLDRHAPWVVDMMHSTVCTFRAGTHAISPGPQASCDPGVLKSLISDPCTDFDFVSDSKADEADDPDAKTNRQAAKNRLLATRVCRTWAAGAGKPFEGSADSILKSFARTMPDCFGTGKSAKGKPAFWLRTASPSVCGAHVRMGSNREWQLVTDVETFFCLEKAPASANTSGDHPRDCSPKELDALELP